MTGPPLIHGRKDTRAFAAALEPPVRAIGGNPDARVNGDWDRWLLKLLEAARVDPILALGDNGLEEAAGSGGHEVRGWLVGMGIGTTFEVAA
jgi:2,3-dihydroxyphenylpropionate 1,2-dioxygenase